MPRIPQTEFDDTITKVINRLKNDPNDRLRSWDHCHNHFKRVRRQSSPDLDLATLHLGFYLASWGMYRGSSDLLQKDYKVLTPVAAILLGNEFADIWEMKFSDPQQNEANSTTILKTKEAIITALHKAAKRVNEEPRTMEVTDTLASKILLVPACIVAFDNAVRAAISPLGIGPGFVKRNVESVISLLQENRDLLEGGCGRLRNQDEANCPLMKILDLYLWYKGLVILEKEKNEKKP